MGEVVVISEGAVNWDVEEMEAEMTKKMKKEDGSAAVIRWERFLPRMVLRVLLVEADDSTRQIISALLRKCSYRVTAVPDGLKAWEVLKGKPNNIDLILTEVELPSISGYALLTLIMEHETCKNIPVIMMSKNDSVSTVYKCMLRGAADFLVKPVRRNELRNLWQHVWRRQASTTSGNGPQNESVAQQKVEATAENSAASNQSSGCMASSKRKRDCIEKGSGDAQSSCTKPGLEDESGHEEDMQEHEECVKSSSELLMHHCEDTGLGMAACKDANAMTQREGVVPESQREDANIMSETCVLVNSSREAIDLIGAFDSYQKCSYRSFDNYCTNKVGSSLLLDLSLRRSSNPSETVNQVSDERQILNHSDASAFSRYINREFQPLHSSASIHNQQKDLTTNFDRQLSGHTLDYNSHTRGFAQSLPKNILSLSTGQTDVSLPCPQQTVFPVPVRVSGIRFENLSAAYGSVTPPLFCTQSGESRVQGQSLAHQQELTFQVNASHPSNLETRDSLQLHNLIDQNASNSTNQTEHKQKQLESSEDQRRFSSVTTDQSASSSLCNGNVDQVAVSHLSVQREVALTKFRLKRKDRCYDKKVRYESRKKLAEQRPRVKGQFVRHEHISLDG